MFPGSFDPFHEGHAALVKKALVLFDEVLIVVTRNPEKTNQSSIKVRAAQIKQIYQTNPRVKVLVNDNQLTAQFAQDHKIKYLLRGFRNYQDFSYEADLAMYNKVLDPDLELVYFFSEVVDAETSSSLLKRLASYKKDYDYE